jgi:hypothetical protein
VTSVKPLIAVCVHDGFYGCGTGAGVANHAFIEALVELVAGNVDVVVLPVEISPDSDEYDAQWHARSVRLVGEAGGRVVPLGSTTAPAAAPGGAGSPRSTSSPSTPRRLWSACTTHEPGRW